MKDLHQIQDKYQRLLGPLPVAQVQRVNSRQGQVVASTETGLRTTPENQLRHLYRLMWVDPDLRARIIDVRNIDQSDPRVKKIHSRTASMVIKGGLRLVNPGGNKTLMRTWDRLHRRLNLDKRAKLHSDARGTMMEGNLALQLVLDESRRLAAIVRMPAETIRPVVDEGGRFTDFQRAYEQYDLLSGKVRTAWPLWRFYLGRLTPDNYDDLGSMGRPYLDATRTIWRKLAMTEEDLVLRRRMRAPQRVSHQLENVSDEDFRTYKQEVEAGQGDGVRTDYFIRGKGKVEAVQGDNTLDQIADVAHLLDTFFAGSPAPRGLFGYAGDLNRDVLEDLKRDFYEEVDALQDEIAGAYQYALELDLLLSGANPENFDFSVQFAERSTETLNQRADRALKYQALQLPMQTVWESAGLDPQAELAKLENQKRSRDPYPDPHAIGGGGVKVTPGNAPKGESATTVATRG